MMGRPYRIKPYQVLADLWLEGPPPGAVRDYRRELNLSTGIARLSYQSGAGFTRELFASAPDRVIVLRIAADKRGSGQHAGAPCALAGRQGPAGGGRAAGAARADQPARRRRPQGEPGPALRGLRPGAAPRAGTLTAEGDSLRVAEANAVTVLIAGATGFQGDDPSQGLPDRRRSGGGQELRPAARGARARSPGAGRSGEAGPGAGPARGPRSSRNSQSTAGWPACARDRTTRG